MIGLMLFGAWLAAPAQPAPAPVSGVSWASDLNLSSLADIDRQLSQPLDDWPDDPSAIMPDKSLRPIKTCRDILAVRKTSFDLTPDNGNAWDWLEDKSIRCLALDVLKGAKPATTSYLGWFRFSGAAIAKLPAGLELDVDSPADDTSLAKADAACVSWGKYDEYLRVVVRTKGEEAWVSGSGWRGSIALYARGDLDGDGIEDLMFRRYGKLNEGSANEEALFLVTQTSPKSCPKIIRKLL